LALHVKILIKDVLVRKGWTGSVSCVFCSDLETIDHLFVLCPVSFHFWNNFNRDNIKGILFILSSFQEFRQSTLSLSVDNRLYIQSLICIYGWHIWKLCNSIISQGATFHLVRSFYFTELSQFSFYTGLSCDLVSLYQSGEVLLDSEDIQGVCWCLLLQIS
jgi:zinc-binding in reverse transcriptase